MNALPKRGQSILEYVVLISLIISSLLIMQIYIKRAYQGRLKQESDELGQQYSPGHTTSDITTSAKTTSTTYTGGEFVKDDDSTVTIPYGMTVTNSTTENTLEKTEGVDSFAKD